MNLFCDENFVLNCFHSYYTVGETRNELVLHVSIYFPLVDRSRVEMHLFTSNADCLVRMLQTVL